MPFLAAAFFLVALLYASVGFGGGSSYNALLSLAQVDFRIMPAVALCCNIIVVTGGSIRFHRAGLTPWRRLWPILALSAPLAFLGGLTPIKQTTFLALLAASLALAGVALFFQSPRTEAQAGPAAAHGLIRDGAIGGGIGYFSGLVGLGGGIFLAPWMHFNRWAPAKQVAAAASAFILVNSVAGLAGQMVKLADANRIADVVAYWPLALAVVVGGQIGSTMSIRFLDPLWIRRLTAILMFVAAGQLVIKLLNA
jgi:uncharacterized protein